MNGVTLSNVHPATLDVDEAKEQLDLSAATFLFFRNGHGRGEVLYRRYDGHYGLISLESAES